MISPRVHVYASKLALALLLLSLHVSLAAALPSTIAATSTGFAAAASKVSPGVFPS